MIISRRPPVSLISSPAEGDDGSTCEVVGGVKWDGARDVPSPMPLSGRHPRMCPYFPVSQVPGEANPINMVTKLSQLTSLLSSIEDKVLGGPVASLGFSSVPSELRGCPGVQTLGTL